MQALSTAASAAEQGRLREAALARQRLSDGGRHLVKAVVRDALAADMDWWALGDMLSMHPQAAWEQFGKRGTGLPAPAQQRPHLAVTLTAGLVGTHEQPPGYGVDLTGVGLEYSIMFDPVAVQLRQAAQALGEQIWICVALPGSGADSTPLAGVDVIRQWTLVLADENALTWLRESSRCNPRGRAATMARPGDARQFVHSSGIRCAGDRRRYRSKTARMSSNGMFARCAILFQRYVARDGVTHGTGKDPGAGIGKPFQPVQYVIAGDAHAFLSVPPARSAKRPQSHAARAGTSARRPKSPH
ncbi:MULTISPECIES: hypothetical protein [Catellatospora]|uniref:Uncharacterized protein n=1 Tax=Catellatospora chokoriensis TaxID=310353 RepID=A0A8J3K0X4_9ACTN|nr:MULTISPECIES: hypothetical protein [Catellatospora]GIF94637.1 hypothetical protein Cch02nite_80810 [Catellatospora chokoriensis]